MSRRTHFYSRLGFMVTRFFGIVCVAGTCSVGKAEDLRETALPEGVTRIVRMAASIDRIAIDEVGRRLAMACPRSGVRIMDLRDGSLGEWIALPGPPEGSRANTGWLMFVGDRLIHSDHWGWCLRIDLKTRAVVPLDGFWPENFQPGASRAHAATQDGSFIAHDMAMADGARLVRLAEDGTFEARMLETGLVNHVSFDAEETTLIIRGLRGTWTLPLDDWKNADLHFIPGRNAAAERYPLIQNGKGEYERMISPDFYIVRVPDDRTEVFHYNPSTKRLHLPRGMTVTDGDDTLWHVTELGVAYRIALPEIVAEEE